MELDELSFTPVGSPSIAKAEFSIGRRRSIEVWRHLADGQTVFNVYLEPNYANTLAKHRDDYRWLATDHLTAQAIIYHLLDTYGGNNGTG